VGKHLTAISIGAVALYFVIAASHQPWMTRVLVIALVLGGVLALSWLIGWALIMLYRSILDEQKHRGDSRGGEGS
jgi:putative Mn2+ efflux pump MntP